MNHPQSINNDIPFVVYFSLSDNKSDAEIAEHIEEYMVCDKSLFTLSSDLMQELIDHDKRVETIKGIYDQHGASCRCAHSMAKLMKAPRLRTLQHEIAKSFHYPAKTILDAFAAKGIY